MCYVALDDKFPKIPGLLIQKNGTAPFFASRRFPSLNRNLGVFRRPLTLIHLQKYRDTNGRRIVIQIGGVHTVVYILLSAKRRAYFCKSIAIELGGVPRYFSKVSGSGVDLTLLRKTPPPQLSTDRRRRQERPKFCHQKFLFGRTSRSSYFLS